MIEVNDMLNKRTLILGLSLALVSLVGLAQGPRGGRGVGGPPEGAGPGGGPGMAASQIRQLMNPMMARLLELTDAQKTAIRERMQAAAEEAKPLREQHAELRKQIQEAIHTNAGDATLEQLAAESGRLAGLMQAISLKARSHVVNTILTAEQRTKLEELRQEFRNRPRPGRRGPGAAAPGGNAPSTGSTSPQA